MAAAYTPPSGGMAASSRRLISIFVKVAISAALFWFVFRNISITDIKGRFVGQTPLWLVAAALFMLTQIPIAALRWRQVLIALGIEMPRSTVLLVSFVASFFNSWLLGNGSGDLARALLAPPGERGRSAIVHSVLFDRAVSLGGVALSILPITLFNIGPLARNVAIFVSLLAAAVPFLGLFCLAPVAAFAVRWRLPFANLAAGLVGSWHMLRRAHTRFAMAVAYGVASELALTMTAYCLAQAQHLDVSLIDFITLMPPVVLLGSLPISIGGWGVRENVLVLALAPFGVAKGAALLLGIQIGLIAALVSLPGGAIWLFSQLSPRRPAVQRL